MYIISQKRNILNMLKYYPKRLCKTMRKFSFAIYIITNHGKQTSP